MCGVFGIRAPGRDVARLSYFGLFALQPPKRGEIAEVLLDRQIEVESRLLEHDPERPERLGAPFSGRAAGDLDAPGRSIEQTRDQ